MEKKMVYPAVIAGLIAVTFCAYAAETAFDEPVLAAQTSSYTTATLTFGTTVQDNSGHGITASSLSSTSYVKASGFTAAQTVSYAVSNCQEQAANYSSAYALQIGKLSYNPEGTTTGSLTIALSGCKYQSVSVYADTYYDSVNYYYSIPLSINGNSYSNDGSWGASSGATQGSCPQYDLYYCDNPRTTLIISVPGTTEQYDMIYVEKIVFHLTK